MPGYQSSYRAGFSTETSLQKFHHDVLSALDRNNIVLAVLIDLSAAFDMVDHDVALEVLGTKFGVGGKVLSFFDSKVNDAISESRDIRFSISQG